MFSVAFQDEINHSLRRRDQQLDVELALGHGHVGGHFAALQRERSHRRSVDVSAALVIGQMQVAEREERALEALECGEFLRFHVFQVVGELGDLGQIGATTDSGCVEVLFLKIIWT